MKCVYFIYKFYINYLLIISINVYRVMVMTAVMENISTETNLKVDKFIDW